MATVGTINPDDVYGQNVLYGSMLVLPYTDVDDAEIANDIIELSTGATHAIWIAATTADDCGAQISRTAPGIEVFMSSATGGVDGTLVLLYGGSEVAS